MSVKSRLTALEDVFNEEDPPWHGVPLMMAARWDATHGAAVALDGEAYDTAKAAGQTVILVMRPDPEKKE